MARPFNEAMLSQVAEWLASGEPHAVVIDRCRSEYGASAKVARRYIARVLDQWTADVVGTTDDERRARAAAAYLSLYREARQKGHTRVAGEMVEKWCRLFGIGGAAQVAVGIFDERGAMTSAAAIDARIAELRRHLLGGGGGEGN